jgi:hypothetical protein
MNELPNMSENNSWAEQWFKAQQQFVDSWSDMAKSSASGNDASQSDLWAQSFELWRKACSGQAQPDMQQHGRTDQQRHDRRCQPD